MMTTAIDLSARRARTELGETVDQTADDDDVVTAYARAVWACLVEPGDGVAGRLIAAHGAIRALEIACSARGHEPEAVAADVTPGKLAEGRRRWMPRASEIDARLAAARRARVALVTPEDAAWPRRADDLGAHAPVCLWVTGDLAALGAVRQAPPAIAIVGARAASAYGDHAAMEFAAECAAAGISVVSGGAYGIDAAAHRGAMSAGGTTVALLAGGVDRPYPAGHVDLLDRVARAGAVAAEPACGTTPTKWRFLARNRLVAALTDATVVVEAGWRSGALNTAHHAAELGRPLGVVPGPITSATSAGCHRLLREMPDAVCVTSLGDLKELLGLGGTGGAGAADDVPYTDERMRILDTLGTRTPRAVDDIARRGGFSVDEAAALLGLLELLGDAVRSGHGWLRAGHCDVPR
ncbi:DNA-processing protein DprA [Microbacterium sp.]|uniref:DNA-processing protein DprA n=1 Tax=Microbacterium sp. TaxID=51671 RepID=UPI0039E50C13